MHTLLKLALSLAVILLATQIGKRSPSLAGLIATMPLAGLIAMVWLHADTKGDHALMAAYTRGALWGILPSILFYTVALLCFRRQLALPLVLTASFAIWLLGAAVHQWLTR
jgi:uncharacterized membrane protein (GlpM family)